jgi:arylsulfatase A-like enzyme
MNIVLFMTDTFRYDNLSCYGPAKAKTPQLDQFAKQSTVFDNAYLGSFPTIPNRLDIMSGRFSFIDHEWCPLPKDTVTLQQILSASAFTTYLIGDNPHLFEDGFDYGRGFNGFEWIRGQETDHWLTNPKQVRMPNGEGKNRSLFILENYNRNTAWWESEEDRFAARSVRTACDWLEKNQDRSQFFLFMDLFDPHEPWDAPQQHLDLYESVPWKGVEIPYPRYDFWHDFLTEAEMNHVRNLYLAEASMVDHWFGVLLDKLDDLGMSEDTIVIFASDHGYLFGEHDITGKSLLPELGGRMYYEAIPVYSDIRRTPLIVRMPGMEGGKHLKALVQSPDLMPTILEMAGLVATESVGGQSRTQALQCGVFTTDDWRFRPELIHGKSLMPLLRGETSQLRDIAVCSNTLVQHTPILAKSAIVTEDGWCLHYAGKYDQVASDAKMFISKLIEPRLARVPTAPMLFNLRDDPTESKDVFDANRALAQEIHRRCVKWLEEVGTPDDHLAGRRELC